MPVNDRDASRTISKSGGEKPNLATGAPGTFSNIATSSPGLR